MADENNIGSTEEVAETGPETIKTSEKVEDVLAEGVEKAEEASMEFHDRSKRDELAVGSGGGSEEDVADFKAGSEIIISEEESAEEELKKSIPNFDDRVAHQEKKNGMNAMKADNSDVSVPEKMEGDVVSLYLKKLEEIDGISNLSERKAELQKISGEISKLYEEDPEVFNGNLSLIAKRINEINDRNTSELKAEGKEPPQEKMKNCPKCGTAMPASDKFCYKCGNEYSAREFKSAEEANADRGKEQIVESEEEKNDREDREFVGKNCDAYRTQIADVINSDQGYEAKNDALAKIVEDFELFKGMIRSDILKKRDIVNILDDLEGEFSKTKDVIRKSKTEEEIRKDAHESIEYVAKSVEDSLKGLDQMKETASGKISLLRSVTGTFELITGKYKNIVDGDEKLKLLVEDRREALKVAIKKLEGEQADSDVKAEKLGF